MLLSVFLNIYPGDNAWRRGETSIGAKQAWIPLLNPVANGRNTTHCCKQRTCISSPSSKMLQSKHIFSTSVQAAASQCTPTVNIGDCTQGCERVSLPAISMKGSKGGSVRDGYWEDPPEVIPRVGPLHPCVFSPSFTVFHQVPICRHETFRKRILS